MSDRVDTCGYGLFVERSGCCLSEGRDVVGWVGTVRQRVQVVESNTSGA